MLLSPTVGIIMDRHSGGAVAARSARFQGSVQGHLFRGVRENNVMSLRTIDTDRKIPIFFSTKFL
jgi:hypothetical protein